MCTACHLSERCLPCSLLPAGSDRGDGVLVDWRRVAMGHDLCRQGEPFEFIYAVRSGTFKSSLSLSNGHQQICAFPMCGDIIGMDGMASGQCASTVTALDDAQVCAIAYAPLVDLLARDPALQRRVNRQMGYELARGRRLLLLMGPFTAQERLAAFLLDLSQRFSAHGYSAREFNLRMSRIEIASFLGLSHETISRAFSALQREGLLHIDKRRVRITVLEHFARRFEALLRVD